MSQSLDNLIEICTEIMDGTIKTLTAPERAKALVIVPVDVDVFFATEADKYINASGTTFLGFTTSDVAVLPIYIDSEPVKVVNNMDIGKRTFCLASTASGSVKVLYEKIL